MKTGALLTAMLLGLIVSGCTTDKRTRDFETFIVERADSLARTKCTEREMRQYIVSYYKDPISFDLWIEQLESERKNLRKDLSEECRVIHHLDSMAGRQLPFPDALKIVADVADTSAKDGNKTVMLQRTVNCFTEVTECLVLWEESQNYEKYGKFKPNTDNKGDD